MSEVAVQGLFYLYFDAIFFILAAKMWSHYKKGGNMIAKYLGISFFFAGLEYALQTISAIFFSHDMSVVTWLGIISYVLFLIAIAYIWLMVPYVFPRFPLKAAMVFYALLSAVLLYRMLFPFELAYINDARVIAFNFSKINDLAASLLLMTTFVPIGVAFVYRTFRRKLYIEGFGLGAGLIIMILFLPVTYQVNSFGSYVFFSSLASIGFTLIALGVVLHPLLKPKAMTDGGETASSDTDVS